MRIERIDDMTVKLFITYTDIEARGFKREDLWTNRKRGEEFLVSNGRSQRRRGFCS